MLPKYDLFIFGLTRSDKSISSSSKALAKEWAKTNRVFYIDRPFSLKDILTDWNKPNIQSRKSSLFFGKKVYKELLMGGASVIQVTTWFTLPINFLPKGMVYKFLNRYNHWVVKMAIKKVIRDFEVKDYIFYNSFYPVLVPFIDKKFGKMPLANVYQSLDEIGEETYIAKHGVSAEPIAVKGCDIPLGTSKHLCEKLSEESGRKVSLLANAADFELFNFASNRELEVPAEFKHFNKPVVVYTGHYSNLRLNHQLVIRLAETFKDFIFLFIGTYDSQDLVQFGLNQHDNIVFIGSKPIEMLPAYLKYSKVAIIPYKKNSLTGGIYPLKVNEYLATGIPTVSINFSKDMESFSDVIYLAENEEEFLEKLELAIQENSPILREQRRKVAENNSWRKRITQLESLVTAFLESKKN